MAELGSVTKYRISERQLRGILSEFTSEEPEEVLELGEGQFCIAYAVTFRQGGKVLVKIAPKNDVPIQSFDRGAMRAEVTNMRFLRANSTVPVPELIAYRTESGYIDAPYMAVRHATGVAMDKIFEDLSKEQQILLYEAVGRDLKALHSIKKGQYGFCYSRDEYFETMWEMIFAGFRDIRTDAERHPGGPIASPVRWTDVEDLLEAAAPFLAEAEQPCLLHGDLCQPNIFVRQDPLEIEFYTDWERSFFGEPLVEFSYPWSMAGNPDSRPELYEALFRGYGRVPVFTRSEQIRMAVYRLFYDFILLLEPPYRQYQAVGQHAFIPQRIEAECRQLRALLQ